MQIIEADDTRMIDLPGVGPCPRPVDIDERVTGFTTLKSLRIYRFQPDVTIEGESEGDEVYVAPIGGSVDMEIVGQHPLLADLSAASGNSALYMPPEHAYRLTPRTGTLVAYARAAAVGRVATQVVAMRGGSDAEKLAFVLADLDDESELGTDNGKERLIHVVAGKAFLGGQTVSASQTIALRNGENGSVRAIGQTSILMVSA
ncbi:MAG: hypothetical protein R3E44_00985 [Paracoccaceae bacterium]